MTYYAPARAPAPPYVSSFSSCALAYWITDPSSATNASANYAVFQVVIVPSACVARRVWWANGAVVAGNVSVAIYASTGTLIPGAKLVECASTAQSGTAEIQFAGITDTTLPPGLYFIALVCSDASATIFRSSLSSSADALYVFNQAGVTVGSFPATATPVESAVANRYLYGFATTASP